MNYYKLIAGDKRSPQSKLQVFITHASHVCSQHSFGLPLRMKGMHKTLWSRAFGPSTPCIPSYPSCFDYLSPETYAKHSAGAKAFGTSIVVARTSLPLVLTSYMYFSKIFGSQPVNRLCGSTIWYHLWHPQFQHSKMTLKHNLWVFPGLREWSWALKLTRHHSSRYLTAIKQPCAINPSSCAGFAKSEEMRTSCSQSVHNLK